MDWKGHMTYITIGKLCKLFNINKQTLQYYDKLDLFKPDRRDEETGYRYYSHGQVYELARIRYLKRLGYSLEEIKDYMEFKDQEKSINSLLQQSEIIRKQCEELLNTRNAILRKVSFTKNLLENLNIDEITIKEFPEIFYIPLGTEDNLYPSDFFYFYPTIAIYDEKDVTTFGAYLYQETNLKNALIENQLVRSVRGGKFLSGFHKGPYYNIPISEKRMRESRKDLRLDKGITNFNIVDQFLESNAQDYITQIIIRIL